MKPQTLIPTLCLILAVTSVKAQDQYQTTMSQLVIRIDTTRGQLDNLTMASDFERIARTEKTNWLPFYYAAYCMTRESLDKPDVSKVDFLCDQATQYLDQADKLAPNKSEVYCLRGLIALSRIKVNQAARGMSGLMEAQEALETAQYHDPANPRVYFLLGQQAYNTPEMFGGSKEKALRYFEKTLTLFEARQESQSTIEVHWGYKTTIGMVSACRSQLQASTKSN
ncbi:tetratricopeptide repeat protein [Spirosoma pollinicola]|uniref:Tetratricopeptide repeat protein n=1 Tax=Spirosoma pollinicola TaxID=2057025 RepID=A0A2K8Z3G5_9BACT|nr:hypothetical protein [Spirosoma pollinicola]AUD04426.1 hypothetical protein CWM47_22820 [Spirosoma pollinicola]